MGKELPKMAATFERNTSSFLSFHSVAHVQSANMEFISYTAASHRSGCSFIYIYTYIWKGAGIPSSPAFPMSQLHQISIKWKSYEWIKNYTCGEEIWPSVWIIFVIYFGKWSHCPQNKLNQKQAELNVKLVGLIV